MKSSEEAVFPPASPRILMEKNQLAARKSLSQTKKYELWLGEEVEQEVQNPFPIDNQFDLENFFQHQEAHEDPFEKAGHF